MKVPSAKRIIPGILSSRVGILQTQIPTKCDVRIAEAINKPLEHTN